MNLEMNHVPVMLKEVLETVALQSGENVVDGTLGAGGHAAAFLQATGPTGRLLGFEVDAAARDIAEKNLQQFHERLKVVPRNFRELGAVLREERGFLPTTNLVFLDLGLSSMLLVEAHKGISFQTDGPLDMRFSAKPGDFRPAEMRRRNLTLPELKKIRGDELTAYDLVNFLSQPALADLLYEFGERNSRKIARYIVLNREKKRLYTTQDLVEAAFRGPRQGKRHPATVTFQALRMVVNDELGALTHALQEGYDALAPGGRFAVLTYHSIEDRTVKQFFRSVEGILRTKKPIVPTFEETKINPRSRSAKLRVLEKVLETK